MRVIALILVALCCLNFALAHFSIDYPSTGVRNLPEDNTTPCSSTTPSATRYYAQPGYSFYIGVISTDIHDGGFVSSALGYGYNPSSYTVSGYAY